MDKRSLSGDFEALLLFLLGDLSVCSSESWSLSTASKAAVKLIDSPSELSKEIAFEELVDFLMALDLGFFIKSSSFLLPRTLDLILADKLTSSSSESSAFLDFSSSLSAFSDCCG